MESEDSARNPTREMKRRKRKIPEEQIVKILRQTI
jgi:hypothetical protein